MANARPTAAKTRARELLARGLSEREVVAQLGREGIAVSKGSVGNWKGSPAKPAKPQPKRAATAGKASPGKAKGPSRAAAGSKASPVPAPTASATATTGAGGVDPADLADLANLDDTHLPAELLRRIATQVYARILATLASPLCDHRLLGELIAVHERVTKLLVMARPPEKLDPEADPLNLSARDELRERLKALRDETEVTSPAVEAVRAYLAELERRAAIETPKAADGTEADVAA